MPGAWAAHGCRLGLGERWRYLRALTLPRLVRLGSKGDRLGATMGSNTDCSTDWSFFCAIFLRKKNSFQAHKGQERMTSRRGTDITGSSWFGRS